MGRISQWAVRRPWFGLGAWLLLVLAIWAFGTKFSGDYNDNFSLPDSESKTATDLLTGLSAGAGTGTGLTGQVVWKTDSGKVTDAANAAVMTKLLTQVSTTPGVACVTTPLSAPLGSGCPAQQPPSGGQGQSPAQQQLSPARPGGAGALR